jgi:transcriptional regulator NrdR family protein
MNNLPPHKPTPVPTPEVGSYGKCPACSHGLVKTTNSRISNSPIHYRVRHKHCSACGHRWKTYEIDSTVFETIKAGQTILSDLDLAADSIRNIARRLRRLGE